MKKKILITVLAILALAGMVTIALLLPVEDTVTHFWFTEEVSVKDGVIEDAETVIPFTIENDDTYIIYAEWDAGKPGMITGLTVKNESDDIVYLVTGESVQSESVELELTAGEYEAQYTFFTNDEDLELFLEEADAEMISEEYTYATNETYEIVYDFELVYAESNAYKAGFLVGLLITLGLGGLLIIFLLKITKKDGKLKCQYDERQLQARGNGFKYGFFTMIFYNAILAIICIAEIELPVENNVLLVLGILLGVFVYAIYCIHKEAYISLNENATRLTVVFGLIGLLNLVIGIGHICAGTMIENGIVNVSGLNLICGVMILVIAIIMNVHRKKSETEEEED